MSFSARDHLRRTLEYRPHIRASYKVLMGSAGLSLALMAGFCIYFYFAAHDPRMALYALIGGLMAALILGLEAHFLARPLASTRVHLRADGMTIERMGQATEISFADVTGIQFSHVPYFGGWFQLNLKSGEKHRFTLVLERSEYILEALTAAHPGLVSEADLLAFRRAAILSDHSWARLYQKFQHKSALAIKYILLPAILTGITLSMMSFRNIPFEYTLVAKLFMLILGLNFALGLSVSFAVSELVLVLVGRERLDRDPTAVLRDLAFENKVDRLAQIGHWIFAFVLLAYFLI